MAYKNKRKVQEIILTILVLGLVSCTPFLRHQETNQTRIDNLILQLDCTTLDLLQREIICKQSESLWDKINHKCYLDK